MNDNCDQVQAVFDRDILAVLRLQPSELEAAARGGQREEPRTFAQKSTVPELARLFEFRAKKEAEGAAAGAAAGGVVPAGG